MTPVLLSIVSLVVEEAVDILRNELKGEWINEERICQNVKMKAQANMDGLVSQLKAMLQDGKIDESEVQELQRLLTRVEL